jgi:hypothetical protein
MIGRQSSDISLTTAAGTYLQIIAPDLNTFYA